MKTKSENRESLESRRLKVINHQVNDIQSDVADLSDSLVDRDRESCIQFIEDVRSKLNMLKEQLVHGDII